MARKQSSKAHTETLRTCTEPSIVGPVTGTKVCPSPEDVKAFERLVRRVVERKRRKKVREEAAANAVPKAAPKRMTREQRTELARTVLQACIALSREHGEEIAVSDRPVTQVLVGRFTIWLTWIIHRGLFGEVLDCAGPCFSVARSARAVGA